jgi:uncharacterized protein YkwD
MTLKKFSSLILMTVTLSSCIATRLSPPTQPPPATRDEVRAFTDLVNRHRERAGCKPLTWLSAVARVAQNHSDEMAALGFFSHTNLRNESPFDRLRSAGIDYRMAAENIAAGQRTAEEVLASWLSSSGHRRNIENCEFLQHGVAVTNHRWTHVFVTLR